MRKNYIYLVLLLAFTTVIFGQKVTLTPTVVNGANVNSGPINLGFSIYSTVSLSVKVETPVNSPDNGTINIYYERNSGWGANIPSGGIGGNLYFGGGKIGLANFVISLNSADFSVSGGNIYAEYKSYSGVTYKSANISVIKNDIPTPPPPTPNNKNEIIPYGGTPLLPKFTEYANVASQNWVNIVDEIVDGGLPFYTAGTLREKTTFNDGTIQYSKKINFFVVNFMPELDNLFVNNIITPNQYLRNGESPQMIIGNEPSESHTIKISGGRNQSLTNSLKNYNIQWQSRIKYPLLWSNLSDNFFQLYGWIDIPGASQMNYLPPLTSTGMEYRRVIIENLADKSERRRCAASNVIEIIPVIADATKNIICCDQTINWSALASPLIGNFYNESCYQWLVSKNNLDWTPIKNATNQNYTPTQIIEMVPRGIINSNPKIQYYRRVLFDYSKNINYTSNTIQVNFESRESTTNQSLKIYPNPTTSILNIESSERTFILDQTAVSIVNFIGTEVNSNKFSLINPNILSVDVSNLITGTYFLSIKSRNTYYQFTFIKN